MPKRRPPAEVSPSVNYICNDCGYYNWWEGINSRASTCDQKRACWKNKCACVFFGAKECRDCAHYYDDMCYLGKENEKGICDDYDRLVCRNCKHSTETPHNQHTNPRKIGYRCKKAFSKRTKFSGLEKDDCTNFEHKNIKPKPKQKKECDNCRFRSSVNDYAGCPFVKDNSCKGLNIDGNPKWEARMCGFCEHFIQKIDDLWRGKEWHKCTKLPIINASSTNSPIVGILETTANDCKHFKNKQETKDWKDKNTKLPTLDELEEKLKLPDTEDLIEPDTKETCKNCKHYDFYSEDLCVCKGVSICLRDVVLPCGFYNRNFDITRDQALDLRLRIYEEKGRKSGKTFLSLYNEIKEAEKTSMVVKIVKDAIKKCGIKERYYYQSHRKKDNGYWEVIMGMSDHSKKIEASVLKEKGWWKLKLDDDMRTRYWDGSGAKTCYNKKKNCVYYEDVMGSSCKANLEDKVYSNNKDCNMGCLSFKKKEKNTVTHVVVDTSTSYTYPSSLYGEDIPWNTTGHYIDLDLDFATSTGDVKKIEKELKKKGVSMEDVKKKIEEKEQEIKEIKEEIVRIKNERIKLIGEAKKIIGGNKLIPFLEWVKVKKKLLRFVKKIRGWGCSTPFLYSKENGRCRTYLKDLKKEWEPVEEILNLIFKKGMEYKLSVVTDELCSIKENCAEFFIKDKCPVCESVLEKGDNFCSQCGKGVSK